MNGVPIETELLTPLRNGDRIAIGPFVLGVGDSNHSHGYSTLRVTQDEERSSSTISLSALPSTRKAMSVDRLRVILEAASQFSRATNVEDIASGFLRNLLDMTRFEWGAVVEYSEEPASTRPVIAQVGMPSNASLSGSLLHSAKTGTASLLGSPMLQQSHSIIASSTTDALAATIRVGDEPVWQLYLATSSGSPAVDSDTPVFVETMVHVVGLVLSDFQRIELQVRQSQLQQDISFAREVQNRLTGRPDSAAKPCMASLVSIPGRGIAGDLVGFRRSPSGTAFFFIGDVSGKGAAAAMLMAATQAYLSSLIDAGVSLHSMITQLNKYICTVSAPNEFVTLWMGSVAVHSEEVQYIDAGHGYAYTAAKGDVRPLQEGGGLPIGIYDDATFECACIPHPPGSRILLCSDGVIEQPSPLGEQLGDAVIRQAMLSESSDEVTASILQTLEKHAGSSRYHDDVTIALIEF